MPPNKKREKNPHLPDGLLEASHRLLDQLALVVAARDLLDERHREPRVADAAQDRELRLCFGTAGFGVGFG
jgi:hypothetical protein